MEKCSLQIQNPLQRNGVVVICNQKMAGSVLGYNPVNERLISVRLKGHPVNTNIIQIYTPTSATDEENVQEFYGKLQELVEQRRCFYYYGRLECKNWRSTRDCRIAWTGIRIESGEQMLELCL